MQSVEIAKAVSHQAKVVIFDEPTSSLSDNEVEALFRIMNDLRDKGVAMVYISHKMDEIKRIADDITIMRDKHKCKQQNKTDCIYNLFCLSRNRLFKYPFNQQK